MYSKLFDMTFESERTFWGIQGQPMSGMNQSSRNPRCPTMQCKKLHYLLGPIIYVTYFFAQKISIFTLRKDWLTIDHKSKYKYNFFEGLGALCPLRYYFSLPIMLHHQHT